MLHREGERFDDYRLVSLLGEGAFGEVYVAEHIYDHEQVAIKILKFQLTPRTIADFLREARLVRLKHPHIVSLLDFGVSERDLSPFLVMTYALNGTLRRRHPHGARVALAQVVAYVQQIASGLQYAHECRLIHRDVKPENILLDAHQNLLLSDFGIVAIAHSEHSMLGQEMAGTLTYMSPEQIEGKPRPASDQYALGVMVYEWLCGTTPFQGTMGELLAQHCKTPPAPLRQHVPDLPSNVESVVLRALAKDPHARFPSVQDFSQALTQAQAHPIRAKQITGERMPAPRAVSVEKPQPHVLQYLPTSSPAAQARPVASSRWLQKGDALLAAKNYKEALAAYNRALLLNPHDVLVYSGRGLVLCELKRYPEALAACDYAIQLDPNFASPYHTKGVILEKLARPREAIAAFEKARALGYHG